MSRIKSIQDVVDWRLCLGCGACAYASASRNVRLVDFAGEGYRPVLAGNAGGEGPDGLRVCPAFENDHTHLAARPGIIRALYPYCGPVLETWEAQATDDEIRFAGASGGLITALSLYCLEREGMHGVLHTGPAPDAPWRNTTRLSRSRQELLAANGSRYAPAAVCADLGLVESAPAPCVLVGQPSEITAVRNVQALRPALDQKIGLTISFFCAGSPSTQGTLDLLGTLGVKPEDVAELRYRGRGWPGNFSVRLKGQDKAAHEMPYSSSWGFLQKYRPYSVHLCPDGTGEDADITCGDPWYRPVREGEPGTSLVLVRTELGRRLFSAAVQRGYVAARPLDVPQVLQSQRNLFEKRGAIWGRILTMRLFGLPTPRLRGFSLFRCWLRLSLEDKLRSTLGTARRIISRRYYRPARHDVEGDGHESA